MATRATYQFISEWSGTHTAYIHHDGYAIGAAEYFKSKDGCTAVGDINEFIRKNPAASLTLSHEAHADTDYRYTVVGNKLTAHKRDGEMFKTYWEGDLTRFVDLYSL